jgi:hypothetical protein
MEKHRIFLVDGKQVAIIKSNEHTYNVRFIKSGKFLEVYKKYVISWYPKAKPQKKTPPKKTNPQTSLDF